MPPFIVPLPLPPILPQAMGNCASSQAFAPPIASGLIGSTIPSAFDPTDPPTTSVTAADHATTIIVVHSSPTPHIYPLCWFFEYHLNLGPVSLGQQVTLYLRAADCFDADPSLSPVAEGWLERITSCSPNWLTFQIIDLEGRVIALLSIPYAPSVWLSAGL